MQTKLKYMFKYYKRDTGRDSTIYERAFFRKYRAKYVRWLSLFMGEKRARKVLFMYFPINVTNIFNEPCK